MYQTDMKINLVKKATFKNEKKSKGVNIKTKIKNLASKEVKWQHYSQVRMTRLSGQTAVFILHLSVTVDLLCHNGFLPGQ